MSTETSLAPPPSRSAEAGGYRVAIAPRVDELSADDWLTATSGRDDVFMDRRFIRAVENSCPEGTKLWSVLVYDGAQPVAAACLSLFSADGAVVAPGWVKRIVEGIRRVFPRYLRFKILFCGLPVSASQSHLAFTRDVDRPQVLRLLDEQMRNLAGQHRASILVFKEFDESELTDLTELGALGYITRPCTAVSYLDCDFGRSFAEYRAALAPRYRAQLARAERRFAANGMRLEKLRGGEAAAARYTDDVHRLYEAVVARSETRLEVLPAEFFRELARQFPEDFRLLLALRDERVTGFITGLSAPPNASSLFIGMDYELNREADLYFVLGYHVIGELLDPSVSRLCCGPIAGEIKARAGCYQRRNYVLVKATNWLRGPLHWCSRLLFPAVELCATRHVFRDSSPNPTLRRVAGNRADPDEGPKHKA